MKVNTQTFSQLAKQIGLVRLAKRIGVDYSYLSCVLNGKKPGGQKIFTGLYLLCKEEGLNIEDYIFLNEPLSTDNTSRLVSHKLENTA